MQIFRLNGPESSYAVFTKVFHTPNGDWEVEIFRSQYGSGIAVIDKDTVYGISDWEFTTNDGTGYVVSYEEVNGQQRCYLYEKVITLILVPNHPPGD